MREYTFAIYAKLELSKDHKAYIFSFCENGILFSCYEENGEIFFGCNATPSPENYTNVKIPGAYINPHALFFRAVISENKYKLTIHSGAEQVSLSVVPIIVEKDTADCFNLGCDFKHQHFGKFELYQYMSFERPLVEGEMHQISKHVHSSCEKAENLLTVRFDGNSYLYKNNEGNLFQDKEEHRPKTRSVK